MNHRDEIIVLAQTAGPEQETWKKRLDILNYLVETYQFKQPLFWGMILPTDTKKAKAALGTTPPVTVWIRHWPKMTIVNDTLETPAPTTAKQAPMPKSVASTPTNDLDLPPL